MGMHKKYRIVVMMLCLSLAVKAQTLIDEQTQKKAAEWTQALQLNNSLKEQLVQLAIAKHLTTVKNWHDTHPTTAIPDGINPATGNKLSDLDKQVILCSAQPAAIRDSLLSVLQANLSPAQVEQVLDAYTVGKVAFTLKGYEAIVPDLTEKERAAITKQLKQARAEAINYKNMKEISAIFEIYKTKCEQYLNNNGRNWKQLYKTYTDKIKAAKAAKQ
jgi:hypothetical protein